MYSVHLIRSKEVYDKYGIKYKVIDLWGAGGITTITDSKMVSDILNWIKEAKKMNVSIENYVEYMLNEEEENYNYFVQANQYKRRE